MGSSLYVNEVNRLKCTSLNRDYYKFCVFLISLADPPAYTELYLFMFRMQFY